MKRLIIFLTAGICLLSCSTAHLQPHTDTYTGEVKVDSVKVVDSVYIDRIRTIQTKADTIYITYTKVEYKYKFRDKIKIDTLVQIREKVVTEVKEVEKKLTWWQNFRIKGFWYLLGVVAVFVIWKIVRLRLHL